MDMRGQHRRYSVSAKHVGSEIPNEIAHPLILERLKRDVVIAENGCWEWQKFRTIFRETTKPMMTCARQW